MHVLSTLRRIGGGEAHEGHTRGGGRLIGNRWRRVAGLAFAFYFVKGLFWLALFAAGAAGMLG